MIEGLHFVSVLHKHKCTSCMHMSLSVYACFSFFTVYVLFPSYLVCLLIEMVNSYIPYGRSDCVYLPIRLSIGIGVQLDVVGL